MRPAERRPVRLAVLGAVVTVIVTLIVGAAPVVAATVTSTASVAPVPGATSPPVAQQVAGPTQDDPSAPADPDQVRDDVQEVMGRDEFSYEKGWMDRFGEWLADRLDGLFPDSSPTAGGSFGGGIGQLIAWVIILLAVIGVVVAVVYVIVRRVSKVERVEKDATETEIEHRRTASAWKSDAEAHEAAGEWKEAIRARYRELVRTLTDRRQLPDVAGRTTRELRADLAVTTPAAEQDFDTASLLFELPWYADVPTGADENARFRAAAAAVLAASSRDAFEVGALPGSTPDGDVVEVTV